MSKYYWLKLQRDFFKRHDIRIVEAMPNGKDYVLFYLKLLVESVDHEGRLRFSDDIPYNIDMLATITNTNSDIVKGALQTFTELGMMTLLDDATIYMNEVNQMIGSASNTDNANRQRRFRESQKALKLGVLDDSVTKCNASVTQDVTKDNESKSKSKNKSKNIYIVEQVVSYLNQKLNSRYKPSTPKTISMINARIKEGFTYDDFVTVIDKKYAEWHEDEKMKQYLTPDTLFGTKFEKYVNQPYVKPVPKRIESHDYNFNELEKALLGQPLQSDSNK